MAKECERYECRPVWAVFVSAWLELHKRARVAGTRCIISRNGVKWPHCADVSFSLRALGELVG